MRRIATLLAAWMVALVMAVPFGFVTDASAATLPIGSCSTSTDVVVAVDFAHWGGPIVRACGSTPTTGFDLLNQGGFHTVGTQHDGPGFVCRISSSSFGGTWYPSASEPGESCVLTPPATGYWAYWHADAGQNSWSYSQTGATSSSPGPGSVDLWVFGATSTGGGSGSGVPSFSPDAVRARNAAPSHVVTRTTVATAPAAKTHPAARGARPGRTSPATNATTSTHSSPTRQTSTRQTSAHPPTTHPPTTHPTTRTRAASTPTAAQAPSVSGSTGPTPTVIDAKPVAAKPASSGSVWPVIIGVLMAVFLAGGAGLTVLRRRRNS